MAKTDLLTPENCAFALIDYQPAMYQGAGLHAHQAGRQLLEECQDVPAPQLTAHNHLAGRVNAVYLEDRLGDIETDCRNRLHR